MTGHSLPLSARFRRVIRSFRFRLTLYFVAILAVFLAGFSIFLYIRQAQVLRAETASQLSALSSGLNNYYTAQLAQYNERENENQPFYSFRTGINPWPETAKIVVINREDDAVLLEEQNDLSARDLSRIIESWNNSASAVNFPVTITTGGHRPGPHPYLFQVTPLWSDETVKAYLIIGLQIDPNRQLGILAVTLAAADILLLVLAFGGGYWLADRAMKPVHSITHTARQISESDLSQRLRMNREDELGELAGTFDQMLDRVQAAFERQRQFTADASHELRTPLAIIELEANRALERPRSSKEYESALQIIQSENEWMSSLVNELLLLARLDSGQADLPAERLDLSEVAVDVVERLNAMAAAKKVTLATGELSEATVQTSRVYLARLVTNLVENAIKYAQGEGARVLVETGSQIRDGQPWGWVRVNDNGPGIPAEHIPHLFNRFYQIDPARSRNPQNAAQSENGSGLGLAIVKSVAEAFGGFVEVKSEAGQGATFTVWLPG